MELKTLVASFSSLSSEIWGLVLKAVGVGLRSRMCFSSKDRWGEWRLAWYAHGLCLGSHAHTCVPG